MGKNDDLNKTETPEATRGDAKDLFTPEEGRRLGDAMQKAYDRDARAAERIRRLEQEARESER